MDSEEAPAQRPVTLDITVEDVIREAPSPEPSSQVPAKDYLLAQGESIDLGGEFATPQADSCASPLESLMDKLNDQMMESVMISDSPNNSEEEDVAPIDSFLDGDPTEENEGNIKCDIDEQAKCLTITTEIEVSTVQQNEDSEFKGMQETNIQEHFTPCMSSHPDSLSASSLKCEEPTLEKGTHLKEEPVPVCTIFSQGKHPHSLIPDGFQPTLIKSPSFSLGSGGGTDEAVTPSKLTTPLVCQPSPSLSKFFTDNGQTNPASDFFDSFMAPSSFISVSNPNAEILPRPKTPKTPIATTPEHQLSSPSFSTLSVPTANSAQVVWLQAEILYVGQ